MRILHAADLHLDSPLRAQALRNPELGDALAMASRTVLERIVDIALTERVDALVLAGDIFDSGVADMASRAALAAALSRLAGQGVPTVMIRGNHDALLDHHRFGPIADGVTVLEATAPTVHIKGAAFHGLSFVAKHSSTSMLPDYPAPEPGTLNIGLMHTSLGGAEGHDPYAPCAPEALLAHGYDYWALGHIHKRSEHFGQDCVAVMPGIPQGRSIREAGIGSVTLATLGDGPPQLQEMPTAVLAFALVPVDLSGADTQSAQMDRMKQAIRSAKPQDAMLAARLVLQSPGALAGSTGFARALAEQAAAEVDGCFVDAVRLDHSAARPTDGDVADLVALMHSDSQTPGYHDEAAALLAEWQAALPADIRDTLAPDTLDTLIADGLDMVAARLTKAPSE